MYGRRWLHCDSTPQCLFTYNDTNSALLYGSAGTPFVTDAFHRHIVNGEAGAVNPAQAMFGEQFDAIVATRHGEADQFYADVIPSTLSKDAANVMRQSIASLLWSKQYYQYIVKDWLDGDPLQPAPATGRFSSACSRNC